MPAAPALTLSTAVPAGGRLPALDELKGIAIRGDHTLEIFLLHQPLIRDYNVYLHGRWFNDPSPSRGTLFLGMVIGFGITLLLSYELRRTLQRFLPK